MHKSTRANIRAISRISQEDNTERENPRVRVSRESISFKKQVKLI